MVTQQDQPGKQDQPGYIICSTEEHSKKTSVKE
jgi:hypothetical protein